MKCIHFTKGAGGDIATVIGTVLIIFNIVVWNIQHRRANEYGRVP